MRINLDQNAKNAGYKMPYWFEVLLNEKISNFMREYQVHQVEAMRYFINRSNLTRLVNLFKDNGIEIETYSMDELPSWGLILPDDNPTIVEYKLKYGNTKDENKPS